MPTKEIKRHARGIVEALESRAHAGPPVRANEISSAREFLQKHEFSTSSDYFSRLDRLQSCIANRPSAPRQDKRNYGGEAGECWMQVQSIYDHVILSTCHNGEFNSQRGRIKLSHRFNQAGRVDFVELKFLRSLQPCLNGEIRKLVMIKDYQHLQKDWHEADAFALRVQPRELIFLYANVFRCARRDILAWLINIGHHTISDLLESLRTNRVNGHSDEPSSNQLPLENIRTDAIAMSILEQAARLDSFVELSDSEDLISVRYVHRTP